MSIDRRIKKLNYLFEPLGLIPSGDWIGQPIFQYKRGHELRVIRRKAGGSGWSTLASGLTVPTVQYELGYQTNPRDNRWVIVKWLEPGFTEDQWERKYHNLGYPKSGYWTGFQPLEVGKNPDEEWTRFIVANIKNQMETSYQQHLEQVERFYGAADRNDRREIEDMIDDALVRHIPGKRGGGASYPLTRHG